MSISLHVAKKYDVQYGMTYGFRNGLYDFQYLMDVLDIAPCGEITEGNIFEIYKDNWKAGIEYLKSVDVSEAVSISNVLHNLDMTKDELISFMEEILADSDPDNDYMALNFSRRDCMAEPIQTVLEDYSKTLKTIDAKMDFEIFRKRLFLSIGNSAEVRDALIASNNILENLSKDCVNKSIEIQIKENEKALSSPARNCDLVSDSVSANEIWKRSGSRQEFAEWLTSKSVE